MSINTIITEINRTFASPNAGQVARNTGAPAAATYNRIYKGLAYGMQRQQRMVFWQGQPLATSGGGNWDPPFSSTAQKDDNWAFHCNTGHGVTKLWFHVVVLTNATTPGGVPLFQVRDQAGSTTSETVYYGDTNDTEISFRQMRRMQSVLVQVTENTDYDFFIRTDNNIRIAGVCVMEEKRYDSISTSALTESLSFSTGGAILDDEVEQILAMGEGLWSRNASPIFQFAAPGDSNTPALMYLTTSSTSYVNMFQTSESSFTASSPMGCTANTQYMGTSKRLKVPVRVAVLAKVDAGTGTFKVVDADGDLSSEISITGTSYAWQTDTFELDDKSGGHHLGFYGKVTSTNTLDVAAISLYQYL